MANFPNKFAENLSYLPADLGEEGNAARDRLADKGFVVVAGLTRHMAGAVSASAGQKHIVEYCPKDPTEKRFGTKDSAEEWLKKGGGRGVFLLAKPVGKGALEMAMDGNPEALGKLRLAGYGWEGYEESEVASGSDTTFAVRITSEGRGNKAGADFSTAIVTGAAALHGAKNVWLECWGFNGDAVRAYEETGWEPVRDDDGKQVKRPDIRPTTFAVGEEFPDGSGRIVFEYKDEPHVEDVRLWYTFPNDRLPQPIAA